MASPQTNAADLAKSNFGASLNSFVAATKNMQALTTEVVSLSMDSLKQTTQAFEKMRSARNWEEVVDIQTEFFKTSMDQFAARSRKVAELASAMPQEMAERAKEMSARAGETVNAAAQQASEQGRSMAEKAGEAVRSTADALKSTTADTAQAVSRTSGR